MQSRLLRIPGGELGRDQHVWCFGSWGAPVIAFPSAAGMAHEWQQQGMLQALAPLVNSGRIKLYCPESNVSEAWTKQEAPAAWRLSRHAVYERWVMGNLLDFVKADCRSEHVRPAVAGCSFGGYYAANFALKHPSRFSRAICMSGRYEMTNFAKGLNGLELYYNNPLAYVPNLEGEALELVRRTHLTLVCGTGKWEEGCIEETLLLAEWCRRKGIPHTRDIWGPETYHDWPCWRLQAQKHFLTAWG